VLERSHWEDILAIFNSHKKEEEKKGGISETLGGNSA